MAARSEPLGEDRQACEERLLRWGKQSIAPSSVARSVRWRAGRSDAPPVSEGKQAMRPAPRQPPNRRLCSFALADGWAPDLPARQRTLRATLDWSHALLAPAEQTLFARLAVFAEGADLAAIEAIGGDAGGAPDDVLERLEALLRASLLRRETDGAGDVRIGMLETIREYAAERLAASGEEDAIRSQHAAYYLARAEASGRRFPTARWRRSGRG